jgi:hypothetical protein
MPDAVPALAALLLAPVLLAAPAVHGADVSFAEDVAPLLRSRCVSCHLTGQEQGELALHARAAYGELVGVPSVQSELKRVEPGVPERSYLYLKLTNRHREAGGYGEPMPLAAWPLQDEQLELIRRWIAEGADAR